jgi:hypothetical protein
MSGCNRSQRNAWIARVVSVKKTSFFDHTVLPGLEGPVAVDGRAVERVDGARIIKCLVCLLSSGSRFCNPAVLDVL